MTQEIQRMIDRIVLTVGMSQTNSKLNKLVVEQIEQLAKVISKTPEQTEDWLIEVVNRDLEGCEVA